MGLLVAGGAAMADDWQAVKLRGQVVELIDGAWTPLTRNELVPDSRVIRTMASGHVTFVRGEETVDLEPNTQIQIFDKGTGKPFTTVKQYFGTVAVEAQVENVQHFAVDTPFLAAVVKGTRFVVTSGETGGGVEVNRGHVQVTDKLDHTQVLIAAGQSAMLDTKTTAGGLQVSGRGKLPAVVDKNGQPVASTGASGGSTDSSSGGSSPDGSLVSVETGGSGVTVGVGNSSSGGSVASVGVGGGGNNSSGGSVASVRVGSNGSGGSAASVNVGSSSSNSSAVSASVGDTSGGAAVDVGTSGKGKLVDVKVGGLLHLHL